VVWPPRLRSSVLPLTLHSVGFRICRLIFFYFSFISSCQVFNISPAFPGQPLSPFSHSFTAVRIAHFSSCHFPPCHLRSWFSCMFCSKLPGFAFLISPLPILFQVGSGFALSAPSPDYDCALPSNSLIPPSVGLLISFFQFVLQGIAAANPVYFLRGFFATTFPPAAFFVSPSAGTVSPPPHARPR